MRFLGIDYGTKHIGLSISDRSNLIASPLKVIDNDSKTYEVINKVLNEYNVTDIVLGLPKNMNNSIGKMGEEVLEFKKKLEELNYNVILEDERLSTRIAESSLIEVNLNRKKRKKVVDKIASSLILQSYLNRRNNE